MSGEHASLYTERESQVLQRNVAALLNWDTESEGEVKAVAHHSERTFQPSTTTQNLEEDRTKRYADAIPGRHHSYQHPGQAHVPTATSSVAEPTKDTGATVEVTDTSQHHKVISGPQQGRFQQLPLVSSPGSCRKQVMYNGPHVTVQGIMSDNHQIGTPNKVLPMQHDDRRAIPLSPIGGNKHYGAIPLLRSPTAQRQMSRPAQASVSNAPAFAFQTAGNNYGLTGATATVMFKPMNLDEKMAYWNASTTNSTFQNASAQGAFPQRNSNGAHRPVFQTAGATSLSAYAGTGFGIQANNVNSSIHQPVPAVGVTPTHKVTTGLDSAMSTPWGSAELAALDSIDRKFANKQMEAQVEQVGNQSPPQPQYSIALPNGRGQGIGVVKPLGDNQGLFKVPAPIQPYAPCDVPSSPSSISRVPETVIASHRSTPLSSGFPRFPHDIDNVDRRAEHAREQQQHQQQSRQHQLAAEHVQQANLQAAGMQVPAADVSRPRRGLADLLDDDDEPTPTPHVAHAAAHVAQVAAQSSDVAAPTPLPIKQLAFTPMVRNRPELKPCDDTDDAVPAPMHGLFAATSNAGNTAAPGTMNPDTWQQQHQQQRQQQQQQQQQGSRRIGSEATGYYSSNADDGAAARAWGDAQNADHFNQPSGKTVTFAEPGGHQASIYPSSRPYQQTFQTAQPMHNSEGARGTTWNLNEGNSYTHAYNQPARYQQAGYANAFTEYQGNVTETSFMQGPGFEHTRNRPQQPNHVAMNKDQYAFNSHYQHKPHPWQLPQQQQQQEHHQQQKLLPSSCASGPGVMHGHHQHGHAAYQPMHVDHQYNHEAYQPVHVDQQGLTQAARPEEVQRLREHIATRQHNQQQQQQQQQQEPQPEYVQPQQGVAGTDTGAVTDDVIVEGTDEDSDVEDLEQDAVQRALLRGEVIPTRGTQAATQARLNAMSPLPSADRTKASQGLLRQGHAAEQQQQQCVTPGSQVRVSQQHKSTPGTSQRTPTPPTQISLALTSYLPVEIVDIYREACGLKSDSLYEWQAQCLMLDKVLAGRNLVFSAPTSAGKTMVYEVLALRRLLSVRRPFMLVLPTVALCQQKAAGLEALLGPMEKKVKRFFGGIKSGNHMDHDTGAIVCTIEMANKLVNKMLEEDTLHSLGCLIVDELHMLGDDDRGYLLELLLTKLRYATAVWNDDGTECVADDVADLALQERVQVIGMSATMPNVKDLAQWLGAALYETSFRPVPIKHYIKSGKELKDENLQAVRHFDHEPGPPPPDPPPADGKQPADPDHIAYLARETVFDGHSCLIFCASKNACELVAKMVQGSIGIIPEHLNKMRKAVAATPPGNAIVAAGGSTGNAEDANAPSPGTRAALIEELKAINGDSVLVQVMANGIAYHHRGLTPEECAVVEAAYKCGAVSVLCCTSTMAIGVNLPARRVIFRHPYKALPKFPISVAEYHQMAGRAGRAGIDAAGESILIASRDFPEDRLHKLIRDRPQPISSCLSEDRRGMKRAVLEVVVCGAVVGGEDVGKFVRCTMLSATRDFKEVVATSTVAALKWLCEHRFISWDKEGGSWNPEPLGKATVEAGMDPDDALLVRKDLSKARDGFVMATDLHLTYLITPPRLDIYVDWKRFFEVVDEQLSKPNEVVMTLTGLKAKHVQDRMMGKKPTDLNDPTFKEVERKLRKFYASLALHDLVNEMDMDEVVAKYGLNNRGFLQDLQERASKMAGMVAAFCSQLGWGDLEMLATKFQGRVQRGVQADLVALTEIPCIGKFRARVLYKAGIKTPEQLAACDVDKIAAVLIASTPAALKTSMSEAQIKAREKKAARSILQGAKAMVATKAAELQAQIAELMQATNNKSSQLDRDLVLVAQPTSPPAVDVDVAQQLLPQARKSGHGELIPSNSAMPSALPVPVPPLHASKGPSAGQGNLCINTAHHPATHANNNLNPATIEHQHNDFTHRNPAGAIAGKSASMQQHQQHQLAQADVQHPRSDHVQESCQQVPVGREGHADQPAHQYHAGQQHQFYAGQHQQPPAAHQHVEVAGLIKDAAPSTYHAQHPKHPAQHAQQHVEKIQETLGLDHREPPPPSKRQCVEKVWEAKRQLGPSDEQQKQYAGGDASHMSGGSLSLVPKPPQQQQPATTVANGNAFPSDPANKNGASTMSLVVPDPRSLQQPRGHMQQQAYIQNDQRQQRGSVAHTAPKSHCEILNQQDLKQQHGDKDQQRQHHYHHQQQQQHQQVQHPHHHHNQSHKEQQVLPGLQAPQQQLSHHHEQHHHHHHHHQAPPPQQQQRQNTVQSYRSGRDEPSGQDHHHLQQNDVQGDRSGSLARPDEHQGANEWRSVRRRIDPPQDTSARQPVTHPDSNIRPQYNRNASTSSATDASGSIKIIPTVTVAHVPQLPQAHQQQAQPIITHNHAAQRQSGNSGSTLGTASSQQNDSSHTGKGSSGVQASIASAIDKQRSSSGHFEPSTNAGKIVSNSTWDVLPTQGLVLVETLYQVNKLYEAIKQLKRCSFALAFTGYGSVLSGQAASATGQQHPQLKLPIPPGMKKTDATANFNRNSTGHASDANAATAGIVGGLAGNNASGGGGESSSRLSLVPSEGRLPYDQGDIMGAAFSVSDQACYYVMITDKLQGVTCRTGAEERQAMLCLLLHMLCDRKNIDYKITSNLKQQMKFLAAASRRWPDFATPQGCQALPSEPWMLRPVMLDVTIISWLLKPQDAKDAKECLETSAITTWAKKLDDILKCDFGAQCAADANQIFGRNAQAANAAASKLGLPRPGDKGWDEDHWDCMRRAALSRKMYERSEMLLTSQRLDSPLINLEMPLVPVIACMEMWGMTVLPDKLTQQRPQLTKRCEQLESHIHSLSGRTFKLTSPQEMSDVLFSHLKIPVPPNAKRGAHGHYSTNKETLEEIADSHPVVSYILEWRKCNKLLQELDSNWDMMRSQARVLGLGQTWTEQALRLRGSFLQTGTVSGRMAMDNPNLQTLPKPAEYQLEESQQQHQVDADGSRLVLERQVNIRAAFVPAPDHVILAVDYRQVELRMMAHFSQDKGLVELLRDASRDPFRGLAAGWLGKPEDQVTPKQRNDAKHLAYGLLYGMGPVGLSKNLGCSIEEALKVHHEFTASLPGVIDWSYGAVHRAQQTLYVETLAGRKRYFSDKEKADQGKMARQAINTICQGSAADLIKTAMIRLHGALAKSSLRGRARLILMVHDELVYEVHKDYVADVAEMVSHHMTSAAQLRVPFPVEISVGESWGELQEITVAELRQKRV